MKNLYIKLNELNNNNILIQNPIKNKFSSYKKFYRIHYNYNNSIILNKLIIILPSYSVEYSIHKNRVYLYVGDIIFNKLVLLEKHILGTILEKNTKKKINHHLKRVYNFDINIEKIKNIIFTCKFSGVWEDNQYIGLIYKFDFIHQP